MSRSLRSILDEFKVASKSLEKLNFLEKEIYVIKIGIFLTVMRKVCHSETGSEEIEDFLLMFELHELWDVIIGLSECDCSKSREYKKVFVGALEKDAERRRI